jgi:hypothetical protein
MLHDFYLYDWHETGPGHRLHGFTHPAPAAENAARCFGISRKERDHHPPPHVAPHPHRRAQQPGGLARLPGGQVLFLTDTLFMRRK